MSPGRDRPGPEGPFVFHGAQQSNSRLKELAQHDRDRPGSEGPDGSARTARIPALGSTWPRSLRFAAGASLLHLGGRLFTPSRRHAVACISARIALSGSLRLTEHLHLFTGHAAMGFKDPSTARLSGPSVFDRSNTGGASRRPGPSSHPSSHSQGHVVRARQAIGPYGALGHCTAPRAAAGETRRGGGAGAGGAGAGRGGAGGRDLSRPPPRGSCPPPPPGRCSAGPRPARPAPPPHRPTPITSPTAIMGVPM